MTVVVYQTKDDVKKVQRDARQPAYEQVWGGREFELTFLDIVSPYVVYFNQELDTRQYGVVVPSPNHLEDTVVLSISDDDYILAAPSFARSQELRITLNSQFATAKTSDLYGFIEPIGQFDVKAGCEVINDHYSTPTILFNAV